MPMQSSFQQQKKASRPVTLVYPDLELDNNKCSHPFPTFHDKPFQFSNGSTRSVLHRLVSTRRDDIQYTQTSRIFTIHGRMARHRLGIMCMQQHAVYPSTPSNRTHAARTPSIFPKAVLISTTMKRHGALTSFVLTVQKNTHRWRARPPVRWKYTLEGIRSMRPSSICVCSMLDVALHYNSVHIHT